MTDTVTCNYCGDTVELDELIGHLASEGREIPKGKKAKPEPVRTDYSREELIAICERAVVPMTEWRDRDSHGAIRQVGECWALLKAGVPFRIDSSMTSDALTVWVEHYDIEGFRYAESANPADKETETSYLPTPERLDAANGKDWY